MTTTKLAKSQADLRLDSSESARLATLRKPSMRLV
jgi:hypothetical protein